MRRPVRKAPGLVCLLVLVVLLVMSALSGCAGQVPRDGASAGPDPFATTRAATTRAATTGSTGSTTGPTSPARAVEPRAVRLLHRWDERRAAAYSRGDVDGLRGLYAPSSRAGRRDASALREYVERGLVVEGMRVQVMGFRVRSQRRGVVRLAIRDRVAAGRIVGARTDVPLPRDAPARRVVTLVRSRGGEGWVVLAVR